MFPVIISSVTFLTASIPSVSHFRLTYYTVLQTGAYALNYKRDTNLVKEKIGRGKYFRVPRYLK